MDGARQIAREVLTALSVLALVFLSFMPPALSLSPAGDQAPGAHFSAASIGSSTCGDTGQPAGSAQHGPCHSACGTACADLPPPPAEVHPVGFARHLADGAAVNIHISAKGAPRSNSRGPPFRSV